VVVTGWGPVGGNAGGAYDSAGRFFPYPRNRLGYGGWRRLETRSIVSAEGRPIRAKETLTADGLGATISLADQPGRIRHAGGVRAGDVYRPLVGVKPYIMAGRLYRVAEEKVFADEVNDRPGGMENKKEIICENAERQQDIPSAR